MTLLALSSVLYSLAVNELQLRRQPVDVLFLSMEVAIICVLPRVMMARLQVAD